MQEYIAPATCGLIWIAAAALLFVFLKKNITFEIQSCGDTLRPVRVTEYISESLPPNIYHGKFHDFSLSHPRRYRDGTFFQTAIAIIEMEDGTIIETDFSNVTFLDTESSFKLNSIFKT